MANQDKICAICKGTNHLIPFQNKALAELKMSNYGTPDIFLHFECLLRAFQKALKENSETIHFLEDENERYKRANKVFNQILSEVSSKSNVSLTENLIIYRKGHNRYFLKVTDYQKGYWAQVPIDTEQLLAILNFFKQLSEEQK